MFQKNLLWRSYDKCLLFPISKCLSKRKISAKNIIYTKITMWNNIVGRFRWFFFVSRLFLFLLTNIFVRNATIRRTKKNFSTSTTLNILFIILKMLLLPITLIIIMCLPLECFLLWPFLRFLFLVDYAWDFYFLWVSKLELGSDSFLPNAFPLSLYYFIYKLIKCHGFHLFPSLKRLQVMWIGML